MSEFCSPASRKALNKSIGVTLVSRNCLRYSSSEDAGALGVSGVAAGAGGTDESPGASAGGEGAWPSASPHHVPMHVSTAAIVPSTRLTGLRELNVLRG